MRFHIPSYLTAISNELKDLEWYEIDWKLKFIELKTSWKRVETGLKTCWKRVEKRVETGWNDCKWIWNGYELNGRHGLDRYQVISTSRIMKGFFSRSSLSVGTREQPPGARRAWFSSRGALSRGRNRVAAGGPPSGSDQILCQSTSRQDWPRKYSSLVSDENSLVSQ